MEYKVITDVRQFYDECRRLTQWPQQFTDWYIASLEKDVEAAIISGWERAVIPKRYFIHGNERLAQFDYFYIPPHKKPDLRYVISPFNWVPVQHDNRL